MKSTICCIVFYLLSALVLIGLSIAIIALVFIHKTELDYSMAMFGAFASVILLLIAAKCVIHTVENIRLVLDYKRGD